MIKKGYIPPYTISNDAVNLISSIMEMLTRLSTSENTSFNPRILKNNKTVTILASLEIDSNLSSDQVTHILNNSDEDDSSKEIHEVRNAFNAYDELLTMDPYAIDDLLRLHRILTSDLIEHPGEFRNKNIGLFEGEQLVHTTPPFERIPQLLEELFNRLKKDTAHPLIKSSVFHYAFEFVRPFTENNDKIGRMWQTLLLHQWQPIFGYLPIETLIQEKQEEYYDALSLANRDANSSVFVDFILQIIHDALQEIFNDNQIIVEINERIRKLLAVFEGDSLTTQQLMARLGLKHRPTFRENYIIPALNLELIEMTVPDKPNSSKQRYRKTVADN